MMKREFSLAYLTAGPRDPRDVISTAARLGYDAVGLRALPVAPGGDYAPFIDDKALLRETQAVMRDTGVRVFDVEIIRINRDFSVEGVMPFLDICGALQAKAILVAADDTDESSLIANYAAFCEAAAQFNLTADLEFMPWTAVKSANDAVRIVTAAAQPNGGVLVDSLHVGRSATTLADIAAIPRDWLHYAQLCDAHGPTPLDESELIFTARCARLLPGEGGIDVAGIVAALPDTLPISVEVPHDERRAAVGFEEWARQALAASRRCVELGMSQKMKTINRI
ncbi:MAG: sugar phosphate isomerase/epimerase family protein [Beijerinckiaceae bacterium]